MRRTSPNQPSELAALLDFDFAVAPSDRGLWFEAPRTASYLAVSHPDSMPTLAVSAPAAVPSGAVTAANLEAADGPIAAVTPGGIPAAAPKADGSTEMTSEGGRVTTGVARYAAATTAPASTGPKVAMILDPAALDRNEVNFTPGDTYFSGGVTSWHWDVLGDIERIWDDFTGAGVTVGVYDDGIQYDHPDLNDNYDASLHVSVSGSAIDPHPSSGASANHGTAVAGLIGAEANGAGTVGVAFGATLAGVNIFSGPANINAGPPTGFLEAADQMATFDVVNNSWGATTPIFIPSANRVATVARFQSAAETGRGGLGTVVVKSAGNAFDDGFEGNANGEEANATRYSLSVGATGADGDISVYSSRGANVLVSASGSAQPTFIGGVISTDRQGANGYNNGASASNPLPDADYTYFNGTSAAAPIVSGVVALMLDANAGLGWRDVQNIMAYSATHLGSTPGSARTGREAFGWEINGATNWNGGGLHFSEDYGYGQVNAYNAVRMAEVWSLFGAAQTSANEISLISSNSFDQALSDFTTTQYSFNFSGFNFEIEYIDVTLTLQHTWYSDLKIELVGPNGQVITLFDTSVAYSQYGDVADGGHTWTFGVNAARGETVNGTWYVRLTDEASGDTGMVTDVNLAFRGRGGSEHDLTNDVYHYTDEVLWALGLDGGRRALSDTDGGQDWLNLAALAGDVDANLATSGAGRVTYASETIVEIASGTVIENVVSGDGADLLVGNGAANRLHGMRGADRLYGAGGSDELSGGDGDDLLHGGSGGDTLLGGDGYDTVSYADSNARVVVRLWNQTATGGHATGDTLTSIEAVIGSSHGDALIGDAGGNVLNGAAGDDYIEGGAGGDNLDGGDGVDTLSYSASSARVVMRLWNNTASGGDADGDVFTGFENAVGSRFNDILIGADTANQLSGRDGDDYLDGLDGDDLLEGGAGADRLYGKAGDDVLEGGAGADTLDGGANVDTLSYASSNAGVTVRLWNHTASGGHAAGDVISNFENIIGSAHWDTLIGSSGANDIVGGAGNDYLDGMSGDDVLTGGAGADRLRGGAGFDTASFAGSDARVIVRLWNNTASGGHANGDDLADIEGLIGSAHGDVLIGSAVSNNLSGREGDDYLDGLEGDDFLYGGDGDDRMVGGEGADVMEGGAGVDTLIYVSSDAGVTVRLWNHTVSGGHATGDTVSDFENVTGSSFNDTLIGSSVANRIEGGAGNDYLDGLGGEDVIIGGAGNDRMRGGAGSDIFDFVGGSGADEIHDFLTSGPSADVIRLDGAVFTDFADVLAHTNDDGFGNTLISKGGLSIYLRGVQEAQLLESNFAFSAGAPAAAGAVASGPSTLPAFEPKESDKDLDGGRNGDMGWGDARLAPEVKGPAAWTNALVAGEDLLALSAPIPEGLGMDFHPSMLRLTPQDYDWIW